MNENASGSGPSVIIMGPVNYRMANIPIQEDARYIYTCQYCRYRFVQNLQLFLHMASNHVAQQRQATFECNECHLVFNRKDALDQHCQTHHKKKKKAKCGSCHITYKSRHCLRRHLKLKLLLAQHSCWKCNKKFTCKEYLMKHLTQNHVYYSTTYECDYCPLKFKAHRSLLLHLTRRHSRL